jgi:hypothetical protein
MKQLRWLSTICAAMGLAWCVGVGIRIWTTPVRYSVAKCWVRPEILEACVYGTRVWNGQC